MNGMTVSQLARQVGTSADTIRYYEKIGLLPEATRSSSGYRLFGNEDVERLAFVKRAQRFGLSLESIGQLLDVRERGLCPCGHARELLSVKMAELDEQLTSLTELRDDIRTLMAEGIGQNAEQCWPCGDQLVQFGRPQGFAEPTSAG